MTTDLTPEQVIEAARAKFLNARYVLLRETIKQNHVWDGRGSAVRSWVDPPKYKLLIGNPKVVLAEYHSDTLPELLAKIEGSSDPIQEPPDAS